MSSSKTRRPHIDAKRCTFCDLCRWMCPDLAITRNEDEERMCLDQRYCKACGICVEFCPKGAIEMVLESEATPEDDAKDG